MAEYKLPFTGQQIEEKLRKADDIPTKLSELENDLPSEIFIATYGETTYEQLKEAYDQKKTIFLRIPNIAVNHKDKIYNDCIANLVRFENDNRDGIDKYVFTFSCDENGVVHYALISWQAKTWNRWDANYTDSIVKLNEEMSVANNRINRLLPLLTSSLNRFIGGFRKTAGTLDIKAPGIYLVLQGGSGNKTMTITQNGKEVYKSPACNGWIVLSSDGGIITPIGIKSGIEALAGSFETPGTYQGWIPHEIKPTHITRITYPAKCVIWYLGNSKYAL